MSVRKSDDFLADVERQYEWYAREADWDVADRYLAAVEATCQLLGQHPQLGPRGGF
jgi:plasmid stabilization system protein ParE